MANNQAHDTRGTSDNRLAQAVGLSVAARAAEVAGELAYIFSDDFASGDLTKTENGFTWGGGPRSGVAEAPNGPALGFTYLGAPIGEGGDQEKWSERRYQLGDRYKEVEFEFDWYLPDGTEPSITSAKYFHRLTPGSNGVPSSAGTNNKVLRLWGDNSLGNTYTTTMWRVGASIYADGPDGNSYFVTEWPRQGTGMGTKGPSARYFFDVNDYGRLLPMKIWTRLPTRYFESDVDSDGFIRVYKDGVLILDNPLNPYIAGTTDTSSFSTPFGWENGYLMGYSNSGFEEETRVFIDNFHVRGVKV